MVYFFVLLAVLFVVFVFGLHLQGAKLEAQPHPKHESFVTDLSVDELKIGFNEALTGLNLAFKFRWKASRIVAEVEIARSFYVELMKRMGTPINVKTKSKLKRDLLKIPNIAFKHRNTDWLPFSETDKLSLDDWELELDDRSRLEETYQQMLNAIT